MSTPIVAIPGAIQPLSSLRRESLQQHLLSLDADDRQGRFLTAANDTYIRTYSRKIVFARDIVVGAFRADQLIGAAHAAVYLEHGQLAAEIGISVDRASRRSGVGRRLLRAVLQSAQKRQVVRAHLIFNSANRDISSFARAEGATVVRDNAESIATLTLNPRSGAALSWRQCQPGMEALISDTRGTRGRVLLIHGAGGDCFQWTTALIARLCAAGYGVCAPVLPGHGVGVSPHEARLDALLACVAAWSEHFDPTVIVGHSVGAYLVQKHIETVHVPRVVLLAPVPPKAGVDGIAHVRSELRCADSRAVIDAAMTDAPAINANAVGISTFAVLGGSRDRVVPTRWTQTTATRYGVAAQIVPGGHQLMVGSAADHVTSAVCAN
jgi:pimeloyl-ACP methyl ester carboxylesterase